MQNLLGKHWKQWQGRKSEEDRSAVTMPVRDQREEEAVLVEALEEEEKDALSVVKKDILLVNAQVEITKAIRDHPGKISGITGNISRATPDRSPTRSPLEESLKEGGEVLQDLPQKEETRRGRTAEVRVPATRSVLSNTKEAEAPRRGKQREDLLQVQDQEAADD
jgi:hypothetical protein